MFTAVPVVDLNGVDDGVTTFADQTGFNVPDKMDIKGNRSGSILMDANDINCADRSKENSVRDDKSISSITTKMTVTDANNVAVEQDGKVSVETNI